MALDADILAWIRSKVGDTPSDADLETRYDRLGSKEEVAREVLSQRYANRLASPAKIDVDGELSEDWTANIKALQDALADPELYEPTDDSPGELVIIRPARRPRR